MSESKPDRDNANLGETLLARDGSAQAAKVDASSPSAKAARKRLYRATHKELYRKAYKKYADKNKEKIRKRCKEYALKHPELRREISKRYRDAHPEIMNFHRRNYDARKRTQAKGGKVTYGIKEKLFHLQGGRCPVCKAKLEEYEMDHIQPLSKGGKHEDANLQLLCGKCNRQKSNKDPIVFMQEQGYLL